MLSERELSERELIELIELSKLSMLSKLSELSKRELSMLSMLSKLSKRELSKLSVSELSKLSKLSELSELSKRVRVREHLQRPYNLHLIMRITSLFITGFERILNAPLNLIHKQAVHDPNINLTGGLVEFLLRVVMKHDDLDDQLNSLEEAYVIDALRFGSKHPWWGIIAARIHLYWWSLITFTTKGIAMSPAGKLVRSVAKKWGF